MNNKLNSSLLNWKLTSAVLIILIIFSAYRMFIPLGMSVYKKTIQFYEQYQLRNNSDQLTLELAISEKTYMIDSLCHIRRKGKSGTPLILWMCSIPADSSQFKPRKWKPMSN